MASRGSSGRTGGDSAGTPDDVLARRVQRGDRAALETLVRRYVRAVHAVAAAYLTEPADVEDAAQETFVRALDAFSGYDPDRPFAPWLYQIARNVARTRLESDARVRTTTLDDSTLVSGEPDPADAFELAEVRSLVNAAVLRLPEQRRTAFRLCDIEGYATAEVARLMSLSDGTVRSHVHHARRALREALRSRLREPTNREGKAK